jgi:hypothetical protein
VLLPVSISSAARGAPVGQAQRGLEALGQALLQVGGRTFTRSITTSMSCFSVFFSLGRFSACS